MVLLLVFLWGLLSGSKDEILIATLAFFITYFVSNDLKRLLNFSFYSILLFFALPFLLVSFTIFRSGVNIDLEQISTLISYGLFKNTEPAGPLSVLNDIINNTHKTLYGTSYLNSFEILVPKFIWPSRPLDLAEAFARENMNDWEPGFGRGFSLLAEGYLNFNKYGTLIHYIIIGFTWGWVWRFFFMICKQRFYLINLCFYNTYGLYLLATLHRGPHSVIIKNLLLVMLPLFLMSLLLRIQFYSNKSNIQEGI